MYTFVCEGICALACMWRSEDKLCLFFTCVFRIPAQVVRLALQAFCILNYLFGPQNEHFLLRFIRKINQKVALCVSDLDYKIAYLCLINVKVYINRILEVKISALWEWKITILFPFHWGLRHWNLHSWQINSSHIRSFELQWEIMILFWCLWLST